MSFTIDISPQSWYSCWCKSWRTLRRWFLSQIVTFCCHGIVLLTNSTRESCHPRHPEAFFFVLSVPLFSSIFFYFTLFFFILELKSKFSSKKDIVWLKTWHIFPTPQKKGRNVWRPQEAVASHIFIPSAARSSHFW